MHTIIIRFTIIFLKSRKLLHVLDLTVLLYLFIV